MKDASEGKQSNSIVGSGWDQNDWEDKSLPNKDRLDELFPDTPVALRRIDGHALLVNQKALDLAGITVDTKVKGGTIIKEDGKLTGVLVDAPMQLVQNILTKPTVEQKIKALQDAAEIGFANGLTSVSVAGLDKEDVFLIDSLQKKGLLDMRVYAIVSNT